MRRYRPSHSPVLGEPLDSEMVDWHHEPEGFRLFSLSCPGGRLMEMPGGMWPLSRSNPAEAFAALLNL